MEPGTKQPSSSPQKQAGKGRSKSTEEIQAAKKAFHTPQKSLPSQEDTSGSQDMSAPRAAQPEQT